MTDRMKVDLGRKGNVKGKGSFINYMYTMIIDPDFDFSF
jgi:hypothetical protein